MAENIKYGSGIFKDAQGNIVRIQGWTEADINTVKTMKSDIETLKQGVAAANSGQRELAYTDLTQPDAPTEGLNAGTYYLVPFNAQNQFLEFDQATGKPKDPQTVPETTDLIVKYFTIMYFNGTALANVGRQDVQTNLSNVVYDNNGDIDHLECEYLKNTKSGQEGSNIKVKGTIHFVAKCNSFDCTIRDFKNLTKDEYLWPGKALAQGVKIDEILQQNSLVTSRAKAENFLKTATPYSHYQFMRKGYYTLDKDSTKDEYIFNSTISLKDSFKKN